MYKFIIFFIISSFFTGKLTADELDKTSIQVSQVIWDQLTIEQRTLISKKFPDIYIFPADSIGIIQSSQLVNRSTEATNGGAVLGSAIASAAYIDRSFSNNNSYSAMSHLGIGILGAFLGSSFDKPASKQFVINYGIKTLDNQIRETKVFSSDEFFRPNGQCVDVESVKAVNQSICSEDKISFLKKVSALSSAPDGVNVIGESSGINVKCNVPGLGVMTIEKTVCNQMNGEYK